jgi:hypothetical protein
MQRHLKRSRLLGTSTIGLAVLLGIGYVAPGVPWRAIGTVIVGIGVIVTVPVLWSMRGFRIRDWGTAPATTQQMIGIFAGGALVMLGIALVSMSVINFRDAEWYLPLVMAPATLLGVYGAVTFSSVALLVRHGPYEAEEE